MHDAIGPQFYKGKELSGADVSTRTVPTPQSQKIFFLEKAELEFLVA